MAALNRSAVCRHRPCLQVVCGFDHTLVLAQDGSLFAFGDNSLCQLGRPSQAQVCGSGLQCNCAGCCNAPVLMAWSPRWHAAAGSCRSVASPGGAHTGWVHLRVTQLPLVPLLAISQGEVLRPHDATAWSISSVLIPAPQGEALQPSRRMPLPVWSIPFLCLPQGEALQPRDATAWLVNSDLDCGRRLRFRKAGSVRRCCAEGTCERAA